jgi:hypothetical protein
LDRTVRYDYAPEALEVLAGHGLHPTPDTPPATVRDALSDLYRYEIRRLKRRLLAGEFSKDEYSPRVIELRRQYWLLSIPVQRWSREITDSPDHQITRSPDHPIPKSS